ncbi:MAG: class I SAM-dependent methyltransferase [Minicystis sp.]
MSKPPAPSSPAGVPRPFFHDAYQEQSNAPWDIGRPQPAFVELEEAGQITGSVLDIGCGTGENALYLASRGHTTSGVDMVETAIARAREKARARGLEATFRVADALLLESLHETFDTLIDSGLFHVFGDPERLRFVESLRAALRPGGVYHLLCFSDAEPPGLGPRRVSEGEIRATFAEGFQVRAIVPHRYETRIHQGGSARAWLASIQRDR